MLKFADLVKIIVKCYLNQPIMNPTLKSLCVSVPEDLKQSQNMPQFTEIIKQSKAINRTDGTLETGLQLNIVLLFYIYFGFLLNCNHKRHQRLEIK